MIQAYHVTKVYDRGDKPALSDLNLEIDRGEFVFLTGPSGAGKTTFLRLLFAAERPTRGQILVNGRNVATLKTRQIPFLRRQIGVIFQDFKLIGHRTVEENVAYALHVAGGSSRRIRTRVDHVLRAVGLAHKAHMLPPRLSGGEQQRIAIARALVNDPVLLLADEPTGNLDAEITAEIMALLEQANARGSTVIVATHDLGILERYPKRTVRLKNGATVDPSA
ncbi:MAG: cell division ATP-binding protein FtsE [Deltaproteobacteria bacterium]|nr:cell division ATP-binding protein FtsE [Deltaproteobacteria bacterium]